MGDYSLNHPNASRVRSSWLKNVLLAVRLVRSSSGGTLWPILAMALGTAFARTGMLFAGRTLMNHLASHAENPRSSEYVWILVAIVAGLVGIQTVLSAAGSLYNELFTRRVGMGAEQSLVTKIAELDLGYFEHHRWFDPLHRATQQVASRPSQLAGNFIAIVTAFYGSVGMLVVLAAVSPWVVAFPVLSVAVGAVIEKITNERMYSLYVASTTDERKVSYLRTLLSSASGAKDIRAFALASHFRNRMLALQESIFDRWRNLRSKTFILRLASGTAYAVGVGGVLVFLVDGAIGGRVKVGDFAVAIAASLGVFVSLASLGQAVLKIQQHGRFLQDYAQLFQLPPMVEISSSPRPVPSPIQGCIELQNVTFTYPGGSSEILRNVSMKIRPGELVGLVGANGAGKTSLVKLLLRFYDPTSGSIRIDGTDIKDIDPLELRDRIAALFQDSVAFQFPIGECVHLGRVTRQPSEAEIRRCLEIVGADKMLKRMPRGLESNAGSLFEGGHDLSGGEWQRLALARFFFREDVDVLILDEPTSGLDAEAEQSIFELLKTNLGQRVGLIISHRFSTIRVADRIVVLEDGTVTEEGTHDQLLSLSGTYARWFGLQSAGYV